MTPLVRRAAGVLVAAGSVGAATVTAHTVVNAVLLRTPPLPPPRCRRRVSVLLPVRDEAPRVGACLAALLDQRGVPDLEVCVYDDDSTDGTPEVVRRVAGGDARVRVLTAGGDGPTPGPADGTTPPPGWLGKPHACQRLADVATGEVLVFVDADVVLSPYAVAATVALLEQTRLDLVSPYPRQLAGSWPERLVQPLLQWSWLAFLPLGLAERTARPSLGAANGQLLAVRAETYRRAGGHAAVRAEVLDDLALLRAVKRAGGRGVVVDGTAIASCRMYDGWSALAEGYSKSLWSAFGSPAGAVGACGLLALLYVVPPVAALVGNRVGLAGYVAGVVGRLVSARRTGGRGLPDASAHPLSVAALVTLTARSWYGRRTGTLTWKGRPLP